MEHIYVRVNPLKDPKLEFANRIVEYVLSKGKNCTLSTEMVNVPKNVDGVLVLGGDGTMLEAAKETLGQNIPLLGVNLGSMGYLTEIERENAFDAIDCLIQGKYVLEERMMLQGSVIRDGLEIFSGFALNDIVLTRKGGLRIIHFDTCVNGQPFNGYDADGMIVSTATGSTGYNMSAGGPIVEPKTKVLLMTPICPHTFHSRSIVFSGEDEIKILVNTDRTGNQQQAEVTFDAAQNMTLVTGDELLVRRADVVTKLVKINEVSFLEALHKKMNA